MRRLVDSPVLPACAFFLVAGSAALRLAALDVMRQVSSEMRHVTRMTRDA
jgi:hypothetical protein